jgi:hypothetical protein
MYLSPHPSSAAATAMFAHEFAPGHIECPERLHAAFRAVSPFCDDTPVAAASEAPSLPAPLAASPANSLAAVPRELTFLPGALCSDAFLLLAHNPAMVAAFSALESGAPTPDSNVHFPACGDLKSGQRAARAARYAAGTLLELLLKAQESDVGTGAGSVVSPSFGMSSEELASLFSRFLLPSPGSSTAPMSSPPIRRAFALLRPPGHHCTPTHSSGNGMVNTVALAALFSSRILRQRVFILDVDIHLSGGTSECISQQPEDLERILLVDVYGARGQLLRQRAASLGRPWQVREQLQNTIALNVALLHPSAGDAVYLGHHILGEILQQLQQHRPDLVLVSCGFDAAQGDDEGFALSPAGYGQILREVCCAAGPLVPVLVALEGGYKPPIVEQCVREVVAALVAN